MSKEDVIKYAIRQHHAFLKICSLYVCTIIILVAAAVLLYDSVTLLFLIVTLLIIEIFVFAKYLYPKYKTPIKMKITEGKVVKLHRQKFEVNIMKTHNYSMVRKPYSNYYRDSFTLTVFIKDVKGEIISHICPGVSSAICDYYKIGDSVLAVSGILLPIPIDINDSRKICPICAELQPTDNHNCRFRKQKNK